MNCAPYNLSSVSEYLVALVTTVNEVISASYTYDQLVWLFSDVKKLGFLNANYVYED